MKNIESLKNLASYQFQVKGKPTIKVFHCPGKELGRLLGQNPGSLEKLASYGLQNKEEPMIKEFDFLSKEPGRLFG